MRDNKKLQVIQNKLNKLILKADNNTPTTDLLEQTGSLSKKPKYIAEKLCIHSNKMKLRRQSTIMQPNYKLSIAREGFIYRSANLYNLLDEILKNEPKIEIFKTKVKKWIQENIAIKPSSKYPSLTGGRIKNQQTQPHLEPPPNNPQPKRNSIRHYFQPIQQEPE